MEKLKSGRWVDLLSEEDVAFIRRFILASGSLKELAQAYQVTYPTVRLRLDRLIQKIQIFEKHQKLDDFERLLAGLYAEGKMDSGTFRQLRQAYKHTQLNSDEKNLSAPRYSGSDSFKG